MTAPAHCQPFCRNEWKILENHRKYSNRTTWGKWLWYWIRVEERTYEADFSRAGKQLFFHFLVRLANNNEAIDLAACLNPKWSQFCNAAGSYKQRKRSRLLFYKCWRSFLNNGITADTGKILTQSKIYFYCIFSIGLRILLLLSPLVILRWSFPTLNFSKSRLQVLMCFVCVVGN